MFYKHHVSVRSDSDLFQIYEAINHLNKIDRAGISCADDNDYCGEERQDDPAEGGPYIRLSFTSDKILNGQDFPREILLDSEFNRESE